MRKCHITAPENCGNMVKVKTVENGQFDRYIAYMHLQNGGIISNSSYVTSYGYSTDIIGKVGGTYTSAYSIGPHLHISVSSSSSVSNTDMNSIMSFIDPIAYIKSICASQN